MTVDRRPAGSGGRVVPNYAVTQGRTRSVGRELPLEALVTATEHGQAQQTSLAPEYRTIVEACAEPQSLVEIGTMLDVPVGVARVLVSDLANADHLAVHLPLVGADGRPRRELLERLLDGLRDR
jgi:hypothetical protein